MHFEFLVEERSAEIALHILLERLLPVGDSYHVHPYNGKNDLLRKLPSRLRSYMRFIPSDWRIVVLVDNDTDDCRRLKEKLEEMARDAGFTTLTQNRGSGPPQVLNRIAIEELEAWFFGDVEAIVAAFPSVPPTLDRRARFRNPDAIRGGTWEALEQVLQKAGYYSAGMPKIETARRISEHMIPERNRSGSFQVFMKGLTALSK